MPHAYKRYCNSITNLINLATSGWGIVRLIAELDTMIDLEIFMTTIIDDFEHFEENSIARGFKPHEFSNLETDVKIKLIKLMARISEKSYRRGLQHGSLGIAIVDPAELRFNVSPDYSPFTDVADENGNWVNDKQSAIDRLKMEYGVLRDIGLSV